MLKVQKSLHFIHVKPFLSFCLFVCIALLFSRCDFFSKCVISRNALTTMLNLHETSTLHEIQFARVPHTIRCHHHHDHRRQHIAMNEATSCNRWTGECAIVVCTMDRLFHSISLTLSFRFFCITFRLFTIPSNVLLLKNQKYIHFVQFSLILVFSVRLLANNDAIFMFFFI